MNEQIGKAVEHYSSLFTLPSNVRIVLFLFVACAVSGLLAVLPIKLSFNGLTIGLLLGMSFFSFTVIANFVIYEGFMKSDLIFNLKRCSAVSLASCIIWGFFLFLCGALSFFLGEPVFWAKIFLLGMCAVLVLRLLVFYSVASVSKRRIIIASFLQPLLCGISLFFISNSIGYSLNARLLVFFSFSVAVAVAVACLFIILINRAGERRISIGSILFLKAFLASWIANLSTPLESLLEKLGNEKTVKAYLLAFRAKGKTKTIVIVPVIHPGPFKNIGSSSLPHLIQAELEAPLHCVVSVPHGISGHDLDLTSQVHTQKVLKTILQSTAFSTFDAEATPLIRTQAREAKATCQIFGKCAFITLTVAPQTMEDLPHELDKIIADEANKRGLAAAITVDAHNSITGNFDAESVTESLRKAAVESLEKAVRTHKSAFEVGAAKVVPSEFSLRDGMGPGGISVVIVKVAEQKTAYVTIDGNNMVSGLREKILLALRDIGIVDGEVLTSDTHIVNGIGVTEGGYYPLGAAIDHAKLIEHVKQAAVTASGLLEPVEVAWRTVTISDIKVIGSQQLSALTLLVQEAVKLSKRLAALLFSSAAIILTALLILI